MYYIWKNTHTPFAQHKVYIGKTTSQKKAEWIYDGLVGNADVAISHKYTNKGDDVWYGYNYIPDKVPTVKSAKAFTKKYTDNFMDTDNKYIHKHNEYVKNLVNKRPKYYLKHFPKVAKKYLDSGVVRKILD